MPERTLHVLELPAPFEGIALGQRHIAGNRLLQLGHESAEVAVGDVDADHHPTLGQLAADLRRSLDHLDAGKPRQRHLSAAARGQHQIADRRDIAAKRLGQPDRCRKPPLSLIDLGRNLAADCHLDHFVDIADIESSTRDRLTIDPDLQVLLTIDPLDPDILRPADAGRNLRDLVGGNLELPQIVTEDLHRDISPNPGDHLIDTVRDRLRHHDLHTRQHREFLADRFGDGVLSPTGRPLIARLERDDRCRLVLRLGVGRRLASTQARNRRLHTRHLHHEPHRLHLHPDRLLQRDIRNAIDTGHHRALLHLGNEGGAQKGHQRQRARQSDHRHGNRQGRTTDRTIQQKQIGLFELADQPGVVIINGMAGFGRLDPQQIPRQHRRERERQHQREKERDRNREGERRKHLALHALKGHQRQKDQNDHTHPEDHRCGDLEHRIADHAQTRNTRTVIAGQMGKGIFDHHDRTVDHQTDRDRQPAKRHQIGRDAKPVHREKGQKRRQHKGCDHHQ